MIIPHEDTYWNDRDDVTIVSGDPLYTTKVDFMRKNNIVVFRIHDHMHAQRPDFTYVGSARDVGLDAKYETAPNSHRFIVPETTLGALAAEVQTRSGRARLAELSAIPPPRSAASSSASATRRRRSTTRKSTSSSAANSKRPTARWTVRSTCSTRSRSASTRVGSCSGTRSPKRPACSRWRSGSTGSSRKCRCNSSRPASRSGLRGRRNEKRKQRKAKRAVRWDSLRSPGAWHDGGARNTWRHRHVPDDGVHPVRQSVDPRIRGNPVRGGRRRNRSGGGNLHPPDGPRRELSRSRWRPAWG